MALSQKLIKEQFTESFLVEESSPGVLQHPTTTDALEIVKAPAWAQKEKRGAMNTLGKRLVEKDQTRDGYEYVDETLECYVRTQAGGTPPQDGWLWKGFFGNVAVQSGVNVKYSLGYNAPLYSYHARADSSLVAVSGIVVKSLKFDLAKEGAFKVSWGLMGTQVQTAGSLHVKTAGAAVDTSITLENTDALGATAKNYYFVGCKVQFINTSSGQPIASSAICTVTGVTDTALTLDQALGAVIPVGTQVVPYLPTWNPTGNKIEQFGVQVYLGAVNAADSGAGIFAPANRLIVTKASVSLEREIKTPAAKEQTGSLYPPAVFLEGLFKGTVELGLLKRAFSQGWFEDLRRTHERSLGFLIGDTAGNQVKIVMPRVDFDFPESAEEEGAAALKLKAKVLEPGGSYTPNDAVYAVFQ